MPPSAKAQPVSASTKKNITFGYIPRLFYSGKYGNGYKVIPALEVVLYSRANANSKMLSYFYAVASMQKESVHIKTVGYTQRISGLHIALIYNMFTLSSHSNTRQYCNDKNDKFFHGLLNHFDRKMQAMSKYCIIIAANNQVKNS